MKNIHKINQNIYITSDEEIKDGDWFLTDDKRVEKCAPDWRAREWHKKIILTTDQDLIKNGVQAIDDEFLEFIVKNSSCEEVETFYSDKDLEGYWRGIDEYQIIIPKEEPKQELPQFGTEEFYTFFSDLCDKNLGGNSKNKIMKQSAVEWLANELFKQLTGEPDKISLKEILEQAKEMEKQQVYSEEDMNDYANYRLLIKKSLSPKEWFKQFKNK
jgi:hypothetical protein